MKDYIDVVREILRVSDRKYLPGFSELTDRRGIVLLKSIFIGANRESYLSEGELIEHDMNILLSKFHAEGRNLTAYDIRMIQVNLLANREIWLNEAKARAGDGVASSFLHYTHSLNGVRNTARNNLAVVFGERQDLKIDCLAANLPKEYGEWNVFG